VLATPDAQRKLPQPVHLVFGSIGKTYKSDKECEDSPFFFDPELPL
jgi:hypothetical protein